MKIQIILLIGIVQPLRKWTNAQTLKVPNPKKYMYIKTKSFVRKTFIQALSIHQDMDGKVHVQRALECVAMSSASLHA